MTTSLTDKKNYQYCQDTIALRNHAEETMFELGKRLLNIRENRLYEPAWDSFTEYLWELDFDETKAKRLIGIYQQFVLRWGMSSERLSAIGFTKLAVIKPHVKNAEEAEELISEIEKTNMPTHDLRKHVLEGKRKGRPVAKCKHEESYLLRVCPDCGERHRVYEDDVDSEGSEQE